MFKRQKWQVRILSFLLALIMVLQDGAAMAVRADEKSTGAVNTVQENAGASGKDTGKEADAAGENGKGKDTGTPEGEGSKVDAGDKKTDDKGTADKTENPDAGKADGKDQEGAGTETGADAGTDEEDAEKDAAADMEAGAGVSGNDIPADISGNAPVLREPEGYYPVEEEDYGELVAYDAYSRTYLTGEAPAAAGQNAGSEKQADVEAGRASYVTVIGPSASYYIDEEGELQETDNTLSTGAMARYALGSVRYENGSGPWRYPCRRNSRNGKGSI